MAGDIQSNIRDPLFVISMALEIIKHRSSDEFIQTEIQRMEKALEKISKMIS